MRENNDKTLYDLWNFGLFFLLKVAEATNIVIKNKIVSNKLATIIIK